MKKIIILIASLCAGNVYASSEGISFRIDGDTFNSPYSVSNSSSPGINITKFHIDLSSTGIQFDTVNGQPGVDNSAPFSSIGGTNVTTGLFSPSSVLDGAKILDLFFNDFNPGETYSWYIDVDRGNTIATVIGNELIGTSVYIDFSDGYRISGLMQADPLSSTAAVFAASHRDQTPNVPEPESIAMIGLGLLGFSLSRKRKVSAIS